MTAVRRSIATLAQAYHTDGPWFATPVCYIGPLVVENETGGVSQAAKRTGGSSASSASARGQGSPMW